MLIQEREIILKNGQKVILKSATATDAEGICEHRYRTSAETHFMARYPEEGRLNTEKMRDGLKSLEEDAQAFLVTAYLDGKIIGDAGVTKVRELMKYCHRAYFGMSILKEYCELGLGSTMMETAIAQARENGFEQIELGVFEDNPRAIHLYEKFGFEKYGTHPRAFKLKDGTYRDEIIMVKFLQEEMF